MTVKDNGGPAFPDWSDNHYTEQRARGGMTLRDYFAVHASEADVNLAGLQIWPNPGGERVRPPTWRQRARYLHADLMLAARGAKQ
jgi:hypothetical protein